MRTIKTGKRHVWVELLVLVLGSGLAGCANLPRDAHGSTDQIQQQRVLRVGVSHESEQPNDLEKLQQREKRLVEKIADRLGARVEWRRGNAHVLLQELEEVKLPIVAATISTDSPFAETIGQSRPYLKKGPRDKDYCLAVAPGENRLLLLVDQVIAEEEKKEQAKG